jgi:hypothetical protein
MWNVIRDKSDLVFCTERCNWYPRSSLIKCINAAIFSGSSACACVLFSMSITSLVLAETNDASVPALHNPAWNRQNLVHGPYAASGAKSGRDQMFNDLCVKGIARQTRPALPSRSAGLLPFLRMKDQRGPEKNRLCRLRSRQ